MACPVYQLPVNGLRVLKILVFDCLTGQTKQTEVSRWRSVSLSDVAHSPGRTDIIPTDSATVAQSIRAIRLRPVAEWRIFVNWMSHVILYSVHDNDIIILSSAHKRIHTRGPHPNAVVRVLGVACPFIKIPAARTYQMIWSANTILLSSWIIHTHTHRVSYIIIYTCIILTCRLRRARARARGRTKNIK